MLQIPSPFYIDNLPTCDDFYGERLKLHKPTQKQMIRIGSQSGIRMKHALDCFVRFFLQDVEYNGHQFANRMFEYILFNESL